MIKSNSCWLLSPICQETPVTLQIYNSSFKLHSAWEQGYNFKTKLEDQTNKRTKQFLYCYSIIQEIHQELNKSPTVRDLESPFYSTLTRDLLIFSQCSQSRFWQVLQNGFLQLYWCLFLQISSTVVFQVSERSGINQIIR